VQGIKPSLKDDLLTGATAIGRYLGWSRSRVYYRQASLPIRRMGQTLVARKSELDSTFTGEVA
jgi:hypothetical protein